MKILTWNILASEWIKKSYYPTVHDHTLFKSHPRIKIIIQKLKEEDADIVFLQEVMPLEYTILRKEFKKYHFSKLTAIQWYSQKKCLSGNITLVKSTNPKKWTEQPLDFGVYVQAEGIHLLNIHLDDTSAYRRKKQIDQLRPILEEKKVILAGDFNQSYKKDSRLYSLPGFIVHNQCITYFVEKKMNIDNILTKGFRISSETCNPIPFNVEEGLNHYGSDHIPVTTNVY